MGVINYVRTIWKAGKEGGTSFSPANFNHMEEGIEQAIMQINSMPKNIYLNSVSDALNILNAMENYETNVFYMSSAVSNAFFGVGETGKGIVTKTSTGLAYDFFFFSPTIIITSRYVPASGVNTIYKANMSTAQGITVN